MTNSRPVINTAPEAKVNEPILSLSNLTKQYGKHTAVNALSFDVYPGDIFGFLGPNGAGKSTTMYMITGLVFPTSGEVTMFGRSYKEGVEVRREMGALIETPAFYEYLSGRKNLEIMGLIHGDIPKSRVDEVLEIVGLTSRAKDKVAHYSHGMKQRLGIAQAILHNPRLLLLDEPTNGLDPEGSGQIWALLKTLAKEKQMTVLVSSHLLHEVEEYCNRIAVINQGILVACDEVKSLLFFNKEDHLLLFETKESFDIAAAHLKARSGVEFMSEEEINAAELPGGEDYLLLVRMRQGVSREILGELVAKGATPKAIVPQRKTLKQFFLELTRRQNR